MRGNYGKILRIALFAKVIALDDIDRQILSALTENGRKPYREIARTLGVSEGVVRQRVAKMAEEKLMRITAIGNLNKMGFDAVAMVLIKVKPGHVEECAAKLAEYQSIRFVAILFGGADIVIQTLHTTLDELHEFVRNQLPKDLPEIISFETYPEVRTIKSSWNWSSWFDLQQGKTR